MHRLLSGVLARALVPPLASLFAASICAASMCSASLRAQDAAALAKRIRGAEDLAARRAAVLELRALDDDAAYAQSAGLWSREKDLALRASLLEHAGRARSMSDERMLAVLERDASPEARFVAAEWFLGRHGREGLGLLQSLRSEKKSAQLERVLFAACASLPKSSAAGSFFAEQFPLLPPTRQLPVLELLGRAEYRRPTKSNALTRLRRTLWTKAKWPPLRGEALRQMADEGDPEARKIARKIARKRVDPKIATAVFTALAPSPEVADFDLLGRLLALRGSGVGPLARDFVEAKHTDALLRGWARGAGVSSKSVGVRSLALAVLERDEGKAATEALIGLAKDRDDGVRRRAVSCLATRGDARVRPLLEKQLAGGPLERRMDALEALAKLRKDPGFADELLALVGDAPTDLRILAIRLGERRGVRQLLPLLPELLGHVDWRVVSAGIEVARRVRDVKSVPLLIKLVARAKGRTLAETKGALKALTRLFYERASDWTRWWARESGSFKLPPAPAAGDAPKSAGEESPARADSGTTAVFYGIPVESRRVAFCLDISGSMGELAGTGVSRLSIAKQALMRALKRMPKGTRVHIIFFDSEVHRYKRRLTTLDPKKLDKIVDFVRAQKPLGETNLWGALDAALEDRNVDTVYVLSDGEPSVGEIVDARELGDELLRLNRRRSVLFHCVSIGQSSALLQRLSRESNGRYVLQK